MPVSNLREEPINQSINDPIPVSNLKEEPINQSINYPVTLISEKIPSIYNILYNKKTF